MAEADATTTTTPAPEATTTTPVREPSLLDWRHTLPPNLREAPIIQRMDTMEKAALALVERESMIGRGVYLPEDTADEATKAAAWDKVYARIGRPESPDKYTITVPEMPKYMEWDADLEKEWRAEAHAAGLSQQQVDKLMAFEGRRVARLSNRLEAAEAKRALDGEKALASEFGALAPEKLSKAQGFFEHFGRGAFAGESGRKAWEALQAAGLDNDPHVIAAFASAMDELGEGKLFTSDYYQPGANTQDTMTARWTELGRKRLDGTATASEHEEWMRLNTQLARLRQEQQTRGRRTAA